MPYSLNNVLYEIFYVPYKIFYMPYNFPPLQHFEKQIVMPSQRKRSKCLETSGISQSKAKRTFLQNPSLGRNKKNDGVDVRKKTRQDRKHENVPAAEKLGTLSGNRISKQKNRD